MTNAEMLLSQNELLALRSPVDVVAWAAAEFGKSLVMSSSFGAEAAVLLHMAARALPGIRVVFVDTGYLFPETHAFMELLRRRFDLNVWVYRTRNDPVRYLQDAGETNFMWRHDIDRCCGVNKNEPFNRALKELAPKAWLRGIRRDQADTRKAREIIEWSNRHDCYAISPLLTWDSRQIGRYMYEHDLPYHPLVEKGYLSIGCNPESCTRAVTAKEDPRAGRWAGQSKMECGIHIDGTADPARDN